MSKNILNVPMYSVRGNQEIIDEIKDEYIKGGHNLCFVQPREKFYKDLGKKFEEFDLISHALVIGKRQTLMHLVQKGTRFGIFAGTDLSIHRPIEYLQLIPMDVGGNNGIEFMALNDNFKWGIPKKRVFWDKEKEILPFIFDDINTPTEEIYPVKYEGKWGLYYSGKKVFVIEPQYEDASVIREGLWAVKKDGKWGFVDLFNKCRIPFEYESVSDFSHGYAHAVAFSFMGNDGEVLLNHQGKSVHFKNVKLYNDQYWQGLEIKKSFVNHEEYSYLVNGNNDIIIPKDKYRYLGRFSEGLIAASIDGDKFGFIDIEENIIIPFIYKKERWADSWCNVFKYDLVTALLDNGKYSEECILINQNNEKMFPYTFECKSMQFSKGHFQNHWRIGDRFKSNWISLIDIINYQSGKDMSYLIRSDAEIEKEKAIRKRRYENQEPYEWTAEDTWDAMTDGMYGDYPGGDIDYEVLGF